MKQVWGKVSMIDDKDRLIEIEINREAWKCRVTVNGQEVHWLTGLTVKMNVNKPTEVNLSPEWCPEEILERQGAKKIEL